MTSSAEATVWWLRTAVGDLATAHALVQIDSLGARASGQFAQQAAVQPVRMRIRGNTSVAVAAGGVVVCDDKEVRMLTVPEAARRVGRNPETVRRWIREGKLAARKVGTQHIIEEIDLAALTGGSATAPLPPEWATTSWGGPMPDVVAAVRRSRAGH